MKCRSCRGLRHEVFIQQVRPDGRTGEGEESATEMDGVLLRPYGQGRPPVGITIPVRAALGHRLARSGLAASPFTWAALGDHAEGTSEHTTRATEG